MSVAFKLIRSKTIKFYPLWFGALAWQVNHGNTFMCFTVPKNTINTIWKVKPGGPLFWNLNLKTPCVTSARCSAWRHATTACASTDVTCRTALAAPYTLSAPLVLPSTTTIGRAESFSLRTWLDTSSTLWLLYCAVRESRADSLTHPSTAT